jgi:hypothetical protein
MGCLNASGLPFSIILEQDGHSVALPGAALLGCGVLRDEDKWKKRDRRDPADAIDIVHPEVMTPVTAGAVVRAIDILATLNEKSPPEREYVVWHGLRLKRRGLQSYQRYYQLALDIYVGDRLLRRLEEAPACATLSDMHRALEPSAPDGRGEWVDLAGWPVCAEALEKELQTVRSGEVSTLAGLQDKVRSRYRQYRQEEWVWVVQCLAERYGIDVAAISADRLQSIVKQYGQARQELLGMALMDAARDFDNTAMVGYGVDGPAAAEQADFGAVRGTFESHPYVHRLEELGAETATRVAWLEQTLSSLS